MSSFASVIRIIYESLCQSYLRSCRYEALEVFFQLFFSRSLFSGFHESLQIQGRDVMDTIE